MYWYKDEIDGQTRVFDGKKWRKITWWYRLQEMVKKWIRFRR